MADKTKADLEKEIKELKAELKTLSINPNSRKSARIMKKYK